MEQPELICGTVFDIQGFSVHDGPGCRTLVFLKGCSLHCRWCSNPEGIEPFPEPMWIQRKCSHDHACVLACPSNAIKPVNGELLFDREKCRECHAHPCAAACMYDALKISGFSITVDELMAKIDRDRRYWGSDGGITLTGGEPFLQPQFAREILRRCYESYIHTAVETCGNINWEHIAPALPWLDWIFFDLKHMDRSKHHESTVRPRNGCYTEAVATSKDGIRDKSHERILNVARKLLSEFHGRLVFRMPLIPGYNDGEENIQATIRFIREIGGTEINILPLHHFGREKYAMLGMPYPLSGSAVPDKNCISDVQDQFSKAGIHCYTGSDTPF